MVKRRKIQTAIGTAAFVLVVLSVAGFMLYRSKLTVTLPDYPPIKKAMWLEQGWPQEQRDRFHHADQGTQTLNMPYEWFIALARLSLVGGDVGRLAKVTQMAGVRARPDRSPARGEGC